MRDYSELELIAKAATGFSDVSLAPDVVLGLIEEYKRVCELNHQQFGDAIRRNAERDQLKAENERLRAGMKGDYDLDAWLEWTREAEGLRLRCERLEADKQAMAETHVLYTWLRKKCDQPSNNVVAVHMNIGHDWATVYDLDADLRAMIEREEP